VAQHRTTEEPSIKWTNIRRIRRTKRISSSMVEHHIRECMAVDTAVLAKDGVVSNRRSTLLLRFSLGYHLCIMIHDEMLCHVV
jgi:hypothetical protein